MAAAQKGGSTEILVKKSERKIGAAPWALTSAIKSMKPANTHGFL